MTTDDIIVSVARDVSSRNSVLELAPVPEGTTAVVRFEQRAKAGDNRAALRLRCLNVAIDQLRSVWPGLSLWLFASTSAWQPKTRIVLHRRLFRALEAAKIVLPSGARSEETAIEHGDRVRYFGVVNVPAAELSSAAAVINHEPESFLAGSLTGSALQLTAESFSAWHSGRLMELSAWARLVESFMGSGSVLFRPFGQFDDIDVGVDVLIDADLLQKWGVGEQ